MTRNGKVNAGKLSDLAPGRCHSLRVDGRILVLVRDGDAVHALDNRCPHMGFPLDRGSVDDGILTCHWHHARFDVTTGGTFDLWADDAQAFPVEVIDGEVWIDLRSDRDELAHHRRRLRDGLERNLSLVIAKAVIGLLEAGADPREPFRIGLEFGVRYLADGWGQGLTVLTCMMNLLPRLPREQHARALFHGLANVASDCAGAAPRFAAGPLPDAPADPEALKRWFRRSVEVRDATGAERCLLTAVRAGFEPEALADMLFAAATDHRYLSTGHVLDFTNRGAGGARHCRLGPRRGRARVARAGLRNGAADGGVERLAAAPRPGRHPRRRIPRDPRRLPAGWCAISVAWPRGASRHRPGRRSQCHCRVAHGSAALWRRPGSAC